MPRALWWSWGGAFSYERGTPVICTSVYFQIRLETLRGFREYGRGHARAARKERGGVAREVAFEVVQECLAGLCYQQIRYQLYHLGVISGCYQLGS